MMMLPKTPGPSNAISIEHKFGNLHVVSCGFRGIKPISFLQIVKVFETRIWVILALFVGLISFSSKHITDRSIFSSLSSIYKLLLEQGGPFPENSKTVNKLKLLTCATLLTGIVISNAFKSENVYNIVTPRRKISYNTIDELVEDTFKIFNRMTRNYFEYEYSNMSLYKYRSNTSIAIANNNWKAVLYAEVLASNSIPRSLQKNGQIHPDAKQIILEIIDAAKTLIITNPNQSKIQNLETVKNTIKDWFWNNQTRLIAQDLHKCSQTAWILPNYYAQEISRNLIKPGNHSDVGTSSYYSPALNFHVTGLLPWSLLDQFSKISASGIVEWWPTLIN